MTKQYKINNNRYMVYTVIDNKNKEYTVSASSQDSAKSMVERLGNKVKIVYPKGMEKYDNR